MVPNKFVRVSVFVLILLLSEINAKKRVPLAHMLPSNFPTCSRNDPQINKCLLDATNQVRPYLTKGVPELRIPSFEPFNIPEIHLEQGTDALNIKSTLKNVVVHGLSKYNFSRFDFDVPSLQFFCEATISNLILEGDYTLSGRILIAPIQGNGRFTTKIDSCNVLIIQKSKEATLKDGKIHLVLDEKSSNSSITVSGLKVDLKGLFDGNEQLAAATNKAINDNADLLFADLQPVLEHTLTQIMNDVLIKAFTDNIPFENLYPTEQPGKVPKK